MCSRNSYSILKTRHLPEQNWWESAGHTFSADSNTLLASALNTTSVDPRISRLWLPVWVCTALRARSRVAFPPSRAAHSRGPWDSRPNRMCTGMACTTTRIETEPCLSHGHLPKGEGMIEPMVFWILGSCIDSGKRLLGCLHHGNPRTGVFSGLPLLCAVRVNQRQSTLAIGGNRFTSWLVKTEKYGLHHRVPHRRNAL